MPLQADLPAAAQQVLLIQPGLSSPWCSSAAPPALGALCSPGTVTAPVLTHLLLSVLGSCLIFQVSLSRVVFYLDTAFGNSDLQFLLAAHADTQSLL